MKMFPRAILKSTAVALLSLSALNVMLALTVEKVSLQRMTEESRLVVHGKILSSYSQWEGNNIFTYTTVRVIEPIKGETSETVIVKQVGGTVGDTGSEIAGTPKLLRNEEVVLFLTEWKGSYWIHSIVLGMFTVEEEAGVRVAYNNLNNVGLIDPVTREEIVDPNQKNTHFPLQDFLQQVRSLAVK
ncbi:MAG: hypothetical protein ACKVRP_05645 [Bacteroidota bacterium]